MASFSLIKTMPYYQGWQSIFSSSIDFMNEFDLLAPFQSWMTKLAKIPFSNSQNINQLLKFV
jgi:hypothetical protein